MNHDRRVPRRDALLRPATMAGVISQRLHAGVPVERIERHYVKYRVGESLRVVYRYELAGATHHVAARSGARDGLQAPEVGAALFPFPHDRKLTDLPRLADLAARHAAPDRLGGRAVGHGRDPRPARPRDRLREGRRQRGPRLRGPRRHRGASPPHPRPRPTACSSSKRWSAARSNRSEQFGATLAETARARPIAAPRFDRLDADKLATAARVIATARPDCADAAHRLLERLGEAPETPDVLIHGDANLGNALQLPGGRVALLDLEHLSTGPAEADLGQVIANLLVNRRKGAKAFLSGVRTRRQGGAALVHGRVDTRARRAARDQPLPAEPARAAARTARTRARDLVGRVGRCPHEARRCCSTASIRSASGI